jgi:hypothetical protein
VGRCPDEPKTSFMMHYYGNNNNTFDKAYFPGWRKKNGNAYYQERPRNRNVKTGEKDTPWIESTVNEAIITWSCDWKLKADGHLDAVARRRISQTPNVSYQLDASKSKSKRSK